jgi:hypothetical protein
MTKGSIFVLGTMAGLASVGCTNENATTPGAGGSNAAGNGSATGGVRPSGGQGGAAACAQDPLRTGETSPPNVDGYDCDILAATTKYGEPDAMIFKAIIYVESRFAFDSTGCTNYPCNIPTGWTGTESQCFGLMQIVLACGGYPNSGGLLPNGHPNLTTDPGSANWPTSIYNPSVNIDLGIWGVSDNRRQEKQKFSGCTEDQYTLMAIGDYNSYGSTKSCTVYNTTYDNLVLDAYRRYSQEAGWSAHPY